MTQIPLRGCAPEPLIHYLKALGILRLVAEQLDPQARAAWHGDTFMLETVSSAGCDHAILDAQTEMHITTQSSSLHLKSAAASALPGAAP